MRSDEQQELFGAPMGDVVRSTIEVWREDNTQAWVISLSIAVRMRKKVMRIRVHLQDDQHIDRVVGELTAIVLKTYYCRGETIRSKMLTIAEKLDMAGYDLDTIDIGSRSSRV